MCNALTLAFKRKQIDPSKFTTKETSKSMIACLTSSFITQYQRNIYLQIRSKSITSRAVNSNNSSFISF